MALPNMAMIPSGYQPRRLYSVLPAPVLSDVERIDNGDFSNGSTDWAIEAVWTIADGVANGNGASGTTQELSQPGVFVVGKTYSVTYEVKNYVSGSIKTRKPSGISRIGNGIYSEIHTAAASTLIFTGTSFLGSITNISVKEVLVSSADFDVLRATPATRINQQGLLEIPSFTITNELITNGGFATDSSWNKGTGWTISGGSANCDGTQTGTTKLLTSAPIGIGTLKLVYTIKVTAGSVTSRFEGGGDSQNIKSHSKSGTYTVFATTAAFSPTKFVFRANVAFVGSIEKISIVKVDQKNIPRLDYTGGGCPVLLTEPLSTNLFPYSAGTAGWSKSNLTIEPDTGISPSGQGDATKMLLGSGSSAHRIYEGIPTTLNDNNTLSVFIKEQSTGASYIGLTGDTTAGISWFNGSNGAIINATGNDAKTQSLGNGWHRISISYVADATDGNDNQFLYFSNRQSTAPSPAFNGTENVLVYGFQVEKLSFPTSYIPTSGSISSRNQELLSNAGTSTTFNSVEGVFFTEIAALANSGTNNTDRFMSISDGGNSNILRLQYTTTDNQINCQYKVGGSSQSSISFILNALDFNKIAFKYKENDFALWVNGVEVGTDNSGSVNSAGTFNRCDFGRGSTVFPFFGKTKQIQVFNTALSDFDLQNLTSNATSYASYEIMRTSLNFNIQ